MSIALPVRGDVRDDIKAGKIVSISIPESGVWPGRAMGVVDAPADKVFAVLADFGSYQHFVPRVVGSKHLDGNVYEIRAKFPWPVNETRVEVEVQKGSRGSTYVVRWKMRKGSSLKKYEGVAWIQPWGKGRSLVTYQMLAEPKVVAPHGVMISGLRKAAAGVIKAVRGRVAIRTASR
jgi:ribosome-associated toxin RatA of RatAB toxin-antitoxin module